MSGPAQAPSSPPPRRVLIAGAGIPALAFGLALKLELGRAVAVTLCDPAIRYVGSDPRAYALSLGSRKFLEKLGIWSVLEAGAQPIGVMTITDGRVDDAVRPVYLSFGEDGTSLGDMIEGEHLHRALLDAATRAGTRIEPVSISAFAADGGGVDAQFSTGATERCDLLVAADGTRSRLRDLAGITWWGRRYPQSGIVATISHDRDHEGRAVQHFLPSGPFAVLPLQPGLGRYPYRSSLVWTERDEHLPRLLSGSRVQLEAEIAFRAGPELGAVALETDPSAHPLSWGLARSFVAERLALLGDAAHAIHPLAGQGLNLALGDAASLAGRIAQAVRLGLDPGGADVLAAYDRDRRRDAVALTGATDMLNRLFSNDILPVRALRDMGLALVDRSPAVKGFFRREASGPAARVPRTGRDELTGTR